MPAILDKLNSLHMYSSADEILPLLNEISARTDYEAVKGFVRNNLRSETGSTAPALNAAIAGLTGLVKGSWYLRPEMIHRPCEVNSFLHQLRLAMLKCDALRPQMRANASLYNFYPEFCVYTPSIVDRIIKIAYAHSEMNPSNSELIPFYSLGGYFNYAETVHGIPKGGARGTTCIMTARAFYHGAGAQMIGSIPPVVGTPNGATVAMGRPENKIEKGKRVQKLEVEMERFVDTTKTRPPLAVGDIYMIAGHGNAQFLDRVDVRDLAVHVGLIVAPTSKGFLTIDGGQDNGNSIRAKDRTLAWDNNLGWTFGDYMSYSNSGLVDMKAVLDQYNTDAAVDKWIAENPLGGRPYKIQLDELERQKKLADNPVKLKMIEARRPVIYNQARKGIKVTLQGKQLKGSLRTVQGWWRPGMFSEMSLLGDDAVLSKLN